MKKIKVIGAGLAGCEAAYQIAKRGIQVELYEMKPVKYSKAHTNPNFAELVCSNSLRAEGLKNGVGVLKQEMEMLDSLILKAAYASRVPSGGSLGVDRELFSDYITNEIKNHPLITVVNKEVEQFDVDEVTVVATGPLTSEKFYDFIQNFVGKEYSYFYDAAAPIIDRDSIDMNIAYYKSRYDKGTADYINCPMNEQEYNNWYDALMEARALEVKEVDQDVFFEGCKPVEEVAKSGRESLLFGAMKPVGLSKPNGEKPYAVVQLRQDDASATMYNIVGFQTRLPWSEQKRIIQMIPGLENAQILKYGVKHRNSFINSPSLLNQSYQLIKAPNVFFAGQMTGVEGYVESAASGLVAGINAARHILDKELIVFSRETMIGAMAYYITHTNAEDFQPMKANFGLVPELSFKVKKKERKEQYGLRAINTMKAFLDGNHRDL